MAGYANVLIRRNMSLTGLIFVLLTLNNSFMNDIVLKQLTLKKFKLMNEAYVCVLYLIIFHYAEFLWFNNAELKKKTMV